LTIQFLSQSTFRQVDLSFTYFRVTLLGATVLTREDDELRLISLQALDVKFKGFLRLVATTVINSNTDGASILGSKTGFLKEHK
jgi:hypothetical protein